MAKAGRVPFSRLNLDIAAITAHHEDVDRSLRDSFLPTSPFVASRYASDTFAEVGARLAQRLVENETSSVMSLLASLEADFRIDYLERGYQRLKDRLSRRFRELHKLKGARVSLEEEIFGAWKDKTTVPGDLIAELRSAFRYRHWIAHGRYWVPKLGRKYDYFAVNNLAQLVRASFPFVAPSR